VTQSAESQPKPSFSPRLTRLQKFLQNRKANAMSAPSTSTSMHVSPPSAHSSPTISASSSSPPSTPYVRRNLYSPVSSSGSLTPLSPLSSFPWSPSPPSPSPSNTTPSDDANMPDPALNRPFTRSQVKNVKPS
jgi:hypothetical protein